MDSRVPMYTHDEDGNSEYCLETCSLVSSISTNATADDLPGAGRTVGLFYSFAGRHLENQLGRLAEMLGKGPRKTAIRIKRRRSKVVGLPAGSRKIKDKNVKIEKDCGHLIKYAQSGVTSTKLQALDHITRFAVEDQFVRDILLAKDAVSTIDPLQRWDSRWVEFAPTLMTCSRKALFSLADTEVNVIAQEITAMLHVGKINLASLDDQLHRIHRYIRDPDRTFLVIRHLERLYDNIVVHWPRVPLETSLFDFIADFDESFSRHFEWNTLDKLYVRYINSVLNKDMYFAGKYAVIIAPFMELIIRYPERLSQTVGSDFFSWFSAFDNTEYDVNPRHAHLTFHLLLGIANANKLDINAILRFDLAEMQGLYPHPAVEPLLYRLTCPPEILLRQIVVIQYRFKNAECLDPFLAPIVIQSGELEHLCTQLFQHVDSEDELTCRRALHASKYLLSTDIYCRRASLRALSATRFAQTSDFRFIVEESEKKCIPAVYENPPFGLTRHCTDSGDLLHICVNYRACCDGIEGTKQVLGFSRKDLLKLHIPRGTSFSAAGHLPLLAGINATGEKAYIALPVSKSSGYGEYIAITEGTKPEDLRMWDNRYLCKRKVVPLYLIVYVLRYAPDAYKRCERFVQQASDDEVGLDATGPYSWKPTVLVQKCTGDLCLDMGNLPTVEEEESGSISVCDDGESTVEEWESAHEWESVDITLE